MLYGTVLYHCIGDILTATFNNDHKMILCQLNYHTKTTEMFAMTLLSREIVRKIIFIIAQYSFLNIVKI